MRKHAATAIVLLVASWVSAAPALAQEAERSTYELTLRDGSRLYGAIVQEGDEAVVFRTAAGILVTVQCTELASLRKRAGSVVNGEFMPEDPNRTRLFFAPTARSLPRGRAYFGTYQVLLPFVQVGVTDSFSLGGGTPLMFGFDDWERPFWITPKLQIVDHGDIQSAVGAIHAFDTDGDGVGIAYGVVTAGDANAALTVGAGMAYVSDGGKAPVVMAGGERRLRRNMKLITENYLWRGGDGLVSLGVRFFGERLSADVGLMVPFGADDLIAFPIVNFVYGF
jgi:hypothetical protein